MESSTSVVFIFFVILFCFGIYLFNREVQKASPRYFVQTILGFCGLNLFTLISCVLIFDPGLDVFLYLFFVSGSLFISCFAAILISLNQYSKDKDKEKLTANIFASFILIFGIVLIWVVVNSLGSMKFWG